MESGDFRRGTERNRKKLWETGTDGEVGKEGRGLRGRFQATRLVRDSQLARDPVLRVAGTTGEVREGRDGDFR